MSALIHVAPVSPTLEPGVRAVQPLPERRGHVGNMSFNLQAALDDPQSEALAILADARVIGFCRIDLASHPDADNPGQAAILRQFAIDASMQRHAANALRAVHAHVLRRNPGVHFLVTSAPCADREALAELRQAGYLDTGGLVVPPRRGPQHLLQVCLQPPKPARHEWMQ